MHVNDNTYMLFHSMELEVRKHLKSGVTSTQKKQIVESVCQNDDVLFYWCMLAVESEDACCGRSFAKNACRAFCKFMRLRFYFNLDGTVQADHEERTTAFQSLATRSL